VFAYVINSIGSIFFDLGKFDKVKKEKIHLINNYMNKNNINKELQWVVR